MELYEQPAGGYDALHQPYTYQEQDGQTVYVTWDPQRKVWVSSHLPGGAPTVKIAGSAGVSTVNPEDVSSQTSEDPTSTPVATAWKPPTEDVYAKPPTGLATDGLNGGATGGATATGGGGAKIDTTAITDYQKQLADGLAGLGTAPPITAPHSVTVGTPPAPTAATVASVATPTAARISGPSATATMKPATAPGLSLPGSVSVPGAPTIQAFVPVGTGGLEGQQQDLARLLGVAAAGGPDSPAAIATRRAMAQQEAAQMSLAASAGPGGRASALRTALQNTGGIEAAGASNVQAANLAAQTQAQGVLSTLLGQTRGQTQGEQQFAASQQQAAGTVGAQLGTALQQAGIGANATLGAAGIGAQASLGAAQLSAQTQQSIAAANIDAARAAQDAGFAQQASMFGGEAALQTALQNAGFANAANLQTSAQAAAAQGQQAQLDQQGQQFGTSTQLAERQLDQSGMLHLLDLQGQAAQTAQQAATAKAGYQTQLDLAKVGAISASDVAKIQAAGGIDAIRAGQPSSTDRLIQAGVSIATLIALALL